MPISDDVKLEILHDHYKETFGIIRDSISLRDRLFSLILVFTTTLLFEMFSPTEAASAIAAFIAHHLQLQQTTIDISFVGSVLWFVLLALTLRYCQTVISIEKKYKYIHALEKNLTSHFGDGAFTREGESYLKNHPLFCDIVWMLYAVLFPVIYVSVVLVKIVNEWHCPSGSSLLTWINSSFVTGIVVIVIFYLFELHFKKK